MTTETSPKSPTKKLSKQQRQALHQKYGGRCAYCGCILPERWDADHLEPVMRKHRWIQGEDFVSRSVPLGEVQRPHLATLENLMPSCKPCNNHKGVMSLEEWRKNIADFNGILQRGSTTYRHALRFGLVQETPKPIVFHFETYVPATSC